MPKRQAAARMPETPVWLADYSPPRPYPPPFTLKLSPTRLVWPKRQKLLSDVRLGAQVRYISSRTIPAIARKSQLVIFMCDSHPVARIQRHARRKLVSGRSEKGC